MNKQMTAAQAVAQLRDGMTIGIGGWGPRRKPMALVREILRSDLKELTVVAYGGADGSGGEGSGGNDGGSTGAGDGGGDRGGGIGG